MNKTLPLRKLTSLLMLAVAGTAVLISSARADTILVDTGTPNGSRYTDLVSFQSLAIRFNLSAAETITGINGYFEADAFNLGLPHPLEHFTFEPAAGTIKVDIFHDGSPASTPAGVSLYSGSFAISDTQAPAWLGVSGVNTTLTAGAYWAVFSTADAHAVMRGDAPTHLASQASVDGGTNWHSDSFPAFFGLQVFGNAVPEVPAASVPDTGSTALLFALGIASALAFSGRRKRAA